MITKENLIDSIDLELKKLNNKDLIKVFNFMCMIKTKKEEK